MPDELLDVIDDSDQVITQATRSDVHVRGLSHRGVHVFLFTPQGELLIQKRSADRSQYASLWDCSVSEHVKAGESYQEAARRGLQEELGVSGIGIQPLVRFRLVYGPNDNETSVLFKGSVDPARVRFDTEEIEQVACFTLNQLVELIKNEKMPFCGWFVQLMHWYTSGSSEIQVLESWA
jgi:isopentenyldiphosphate isomerase